ncbi:hypothetical protein DXG01_010326 [Tephrocybe rancida]|nr:hypothetical protein DXG01_010326 [Tephrocybe rancida]
MPSIVAFLLLLPFTAQAARLNDWFKPFFQGECFYDLPAWNTEASGPLKITILGCSPGAIAQDIRLVCNSDDTKEAGCDHLFQSTGAVNKLVRLPESCGKSAFARVSRAWMPDDQSLPEDVARRFVGRALQPQIQALTLNTNFAAVNLLRATLPGSEGNLAVTPPATALVRRGHSTRGRRGLFSFVENAFDKFNTFDQTTTKSLKGLNVAKTFSNHYHARRGHCWDIVPPKLTEFGMFAGLDATLDARLEMKGNVAAKADSGRITFFEVGIPGLDFPGALTLGPSFKILGQTTATLDVDVDMVVDLSYSVNDAKLFFPPSSKHASGGPFSPGKARAQLISFTNSYNDLSHLALKLSVSPSLASKAVVVAHVIPRLDVGVSALDGAAKATIFLDLDTSASITMTLNAAASASVGVETTNKAVTKGASASVDGCISASTAFNVNAGAKGSFFGIFDKGTKVLLFGKDSELFKVCLFRKTRTTHR